MNKLKEPIAVKKKRKHGPFMTFLLDVLNGNVLAKEEVLVHLPFLLFTAFIGLMYIANGFLAEDVLRKLDRANTELKELRSEYITTKSDLMYVSKQSEIAAIIVEKELGLAESIEPPKKIVVEPGSSWLEQ